MISTSHLHPILVHFPIALIITGFIAEIVFIYFKKKVCLKEAGFYLLITGTVCAFFALLAGILFTGELIGEAGIVQETHETMAWITLGALIITSVLHLIIRSNNNKYTRLKRIAFIAYGLAAISVSITGFYGGKLVYNYMMFL